MEFFNLEPLPPQYPEKDMALATPYAIQISGLCGAPQTERFSPLTAWVTFATPPGPAYTDAFTPPNLTVTRSRKGHPPP